MTYKKLCSSKITFCSGVIIFFSSSHMHIYIYICIYIYILLSSHKSLFLSVQTLKYMKSTMKRCLPINSDALHSWFIISKNKQTKCYDIKTRYRYVYGIPIKHRNSTCVCVCVCLRSMRGRSGMFHLSPGIWEECVWQTGANRGWRGWHAGFGLRTHQDVRLLDLKC